MKITLNELKKMIKEALEEGWTEDSDDPDAEDPEIMAWKPAKLNSKARLVIERIIADGIKLKFSSAEITKNVLEALLIRGYISL